MTRALARAQARVGRERRDARGVHYSRKRRDVNRHPTFWEHGEFVAIDGEGFSDGAEFTTEIGASGNVYRGREHFYAYLSSSDGREIYSPDGRLATGDVLEFLASIATDNPRAVIVVFGGSYDVAHMFGHSLDPSSVKRMLGKEVGRCRIQTLDYDWEIEYRPRKCLTVRRFAADTPRWITNARGLRVAAPHLTIRVWDVWGFFQDSFNGVLDKWLADDPEREFIRRMKGNRSIFERHEFEEIRRYNAAELRCLVKVMERVRAAINDLGFKITRWDGAGAVAAALMAKHKVKDHIAELPPPVFEAARRAYSGGHIEAVRIGRHVGAVHHYDINSAYPDQFRRLPCLSAGRWIAGEGEPPDGFTLVKTAFEFPSGEPFYPLFYRKENGTIFYPDRGCGWYWLAEFEVARARWPECVTVLEWWHFKPDNDNAASPFDWVASYYLTRQSLVRADKERGQSDGREKIIKLGLNSLYGKTAQQVGWRRDRETGDLRLPPYFNLAWAGFVTAGCRAKMMEAALERPHSVIMFATDGLFTTEPLDLYAPAEKELGAWDYQAHDGITVVMPGVYWLHDGETHKHYSRGFDKAEMSDAEFVWKAWGARKETVQISITRMIGLGTAAASADFWKIRGCFATSLRSLALDGDNSKRYALDLRRARPHLGLVTTEPRQHDLPNLLGIEDSAPYPIDWIDGRVDYDADEVANDDGEAMDAELA